MKPMWTVAVSAITMTLAVAVMAMVRLSLLTWMVWAGAWMAVNRGKVSARARKRGIFIGRLLWSLAVRRRWPCVWAWRRAFVWGRGGPARVVGRRRGLGRWI